MKAHLFEVLRNGKFTIGLLKRLLAMGLHNAIEKVSERSSHIEAKEHFEKL
jgi:hypothetical protein